MKEGIQETAVLWDEFFCILVLPKTNLLTTSSGHSLPEVNHTEAETSEKQTYPLSGPRTDLAPDSSPLLPPPP
ncbi:hypothetical protein MLD38_031026 [Melastoma candidum]|uniref:Uncharacterized protein n=1 Tax=Melastoma candidum TaxID=119954 RepID=A0ACB9MN38_9MYRT|nr:hypothetical protein MLD38_031026 [Melastoma candidum]